MCKKLIVLLLFCVICLTGCENNKQLYLTNKYYNNGEYIEVTKDDLDNRKDETYVLFTYNNYCSFSVPCDEIFKETMKKYKIDFLSIPFEQFKSTKFYEKIKYGPSIIIVNKDKIIKYLDAEADEDLNRYQDSKEFEEWLGKYIYLEKQG